jgi:ABC-2 type transport system ATP-binding protein
MMKPNLAIEAVGLTKYFGTKKAVDSLDLAVPRGAVFAFLGRNGAGKTTTLLMLLGFLRPTRGTSTVLGHASWRLSPAARGRIGYVAESHPLHDGWKVETEAAFAAGFHPRWNWSLYKSIVERFDLSPTARTDTLSRGERAGLSLAITLAPEPELLILDEPTLGLDPIARGALLQAIASGACESGRTVLISSHYLHDVERIADHAAVLEGSRLRIAGPIDSIAESMRRFRLAFAPGTVPARIPAIRGLLSTSQLGDTLVVTILEPGNDTTAVLTSLRPIAVIEESVPFVDAVASYLDSDAGTESLEHETAQPVAGGV